MSPGGSSVPDVTSALPGANLILHRLTLSSLRSPSYVRGINTPPTIVHEQSLAMQGFFFLVDIFLRSWHQDAQLRLRLERAIWVTS